MITIGAWLCSIASGDSCRLSVADSLLCALTDIISKSCLPTPQSGHVQSSGISAHRVPAKMSSSGQPLDSSYTQPQITHSQIWNGSPELSATGTASGSPLGCLGFSSGVATLVAMAERPVLTISKSCFVTPQSGQLQS